MSLRKGGGVEKNDEAKGKGKDENGGKGKGFEKGKPQKNGGKGEIICWTCGGRGHQASICPKKVNEVPDQGPDGSEKKVETLDVWLFSIEHICVGVESPRLESSLLVDSGSENHHSTNRRWSHTSPLRRENCTCEDTSRYFIGHQVSCC
eukprot:3489040-Amphidinium_carterae.2